MKSKQLKMKSRTYTLKKVENHNPYLFGDRLRRAPDQVWQLRYDDYPAENTYFTSEKAALQHIKRVEEISKHMTHQ